MLGEESFLPVNSEPTATLDKCPCVLNNAMTLHGAWLPALCGNLVVALHGHGTRVPALSPQEVWPGLV